MINSAGEYDVVVVGAGPAGAAAALRAAELGARVALVERLRPGGTCTNRGCVPTRALAILARLLRDIRSAGAGGIQVAAPTLDWSRAVQDVHETIDAVNANKRVVERLEALGGTFYLEGPAAFIDSHTIRLAQSERLLRGRSFILCTGGEARRPAIPGVELATFPEQLLRMPRVPRTCAIVGSGYTGVQLTTILNAFGTRVSLLESAPTILPPADADVSRALHAAFRRQGITLHTGIQGLRGISNGGGGRRLAYITAAGTPAELEAEAVVLCIGWPAATQGLGLEKAGVETDRGFVTADAALRTNVRHILVAGDANGRDMLVQGAEFEGAHAAENAVRGTDTAYQRGLLPSGGFTDPDHAGVGMTDAEAAARGLDVLSQTVNYTELDRAIIDGRTTGFVKLIAERRTGLLLGAHGAGENAMELIQTAAVAMAHGGDVERLAAVRLAYPTYTAILGEAARRLHRRIRSAQAVPADGAVEVTR